MELNVAMYFTNLHINFAYVSLCSELCYGCMTIHNSQQWHQCKYKKEKIFFKNVKKNIFSNQRFYYMIVFILLARYFQITLKNKLNC